MKKKSSRIPLLGLAIVLVSGGLIYSKVRQNSSGPSGLSAAPGAALAAEKGCTACHSVDGTPGIGPSWKGTYGTVRIMADGSQRVADDAYLRNSMLAPAAEVVTGFENVMIPPELSEDEITQLIQSIKQLGTQPSE